MADNDKLQNAVNKGAAELLPPSRDSIRAGVFASRQVKKKVVKFFGCTIEIRQPQLADILQARQEGEKDGVIGILIDHAYVPGTDQKLFEDTDKAALLQLPFGQDFVDVSSALEELTNVNFPKSAETSSKTQGST